MEKLTEKELIIRDRSDCEWTMSTEQGRRFLWKLLEHCGIYKDIAGEGIIAYKQIGQRQVGLHLLELISDASEDLLFTMMKEAKNRVIKEIEDERDVTTNNTPDTSTERITGSIEDYVGELPSYSDNTSGGIPGF